MLDFKRDVLADEERDAIRTLRTFGWVAFSSPYVDDFADQDGAVLPGRMSIAICKPIKN